MRNISLITMVIISAALGACNNSGSGGTKIFKYSGELQCEPDSGIPRDEMMLELTEAGIDVLCSQTGSDGNVYPTVCGVPSGKINIYLIRSVNLEDAENLGFASVMTLPDYRDSDCG